MFARNVLLGNSKMSNPKPSIADAENAATATSEQYRILRAALRGDHFEHGAGGMRVRRKVSKAADQIAKAAGEELAGAFLAVGNSKFSEALAEAAFTTLGGKRGRAAIAAIPVVSSKAVQIPSIKVIAEPKPAAVRRNGITVPMLMAVATGEIRRDVIHLRFTAASAAYAVREAIRTLAAQHLLARAMAGAKSFVVGMPKRVLPLAIGLSLVGTAVIGQEITVHLTDQEVTYPKGYENIADAYPAADANDWRFPVNISPPSMGFVGAPSDTPAPPTRHFLELAHKALSITLKDNVLAAHHVGRMVQAMESCATREQACRVESLGIKLDQVNGHHTLLLLPSAGFSLKQEELAFEYRETGITQRDVAEYVEAAYGEMFPTVDISPKY